MTELEIQDVNGTEWDYLIVLDACRYDYFEKHYSDFLEGELSKKKSKGTSTVEWLPKTFESRYNYKYISANPYCNSYGIGLTDLMPDFEYDWNATRTFTEIIDSWERDWDSEENTVRPEDITDTAIEEDNSGKMVIHYIQPHRPFISCPQEQKVWNLNEKIDSMAKGEQADNQQSLKRKMISSTKPVWDKFFWKLPYRVRWKIKDLLRLDNPHWGALVQEVGEEKVHEYYQEDLRMALKEVRRFVDQIDGKIIVTADHGEALGEHNDWGHQVGSDNPKQYTVPWLEVEGVKK